MLIHLTFKTNCFIFAVHDINTISQKDYDLAIELLSRDQLSNLLDLLNELGIDVILKKGQLTREKEEYLANRLTKSEYSVFRSKLAQSVLELVKSELDEMDVERYFYSKNMTRVLKHETKIVSGLKDVLKKSKLEDSHLFSLAKRVLSNFIDTIDKIEGNEMDAADGAFFLVEKRMILMEELGRIKKTALNYSLN